MNLYQYILLFCFLLQQLVYCFGQFAYNSRNRRAFGNAGVSEGFGGSSSSNNFQDASTYTTFLLFTRYTGENYATVYPYDAESLFRGGFQSAKNTKILFPGWTNDGISGGMGVLRRAYLAAEDMNVISVNWPQVCKMAYPIACTASAHVGRYAAQLIDFLISEVGVSVTSIHLLGFSLGAHTAGATGKHVTSATVHRITGLDPAGPMFTNNPNNRLDASDADFVDVIHTDCGMLGFSNPIGTADFYPNSGHAPQPGCNQGSSGGSHSRAYQYFAESITSDGFIATQCDSWQNFDRGWCRNENTTVMGEHIDLSAQGVYYLYTNSRSPFAVW